jgi:hypothetical protein
MVMVSPASLPQPITGGIASGEYLWKSRQNPPTVTR